LLILLTRHNRFLKSNCSKVHGDRVTNKTRCVAVPSLMSARWVSQNSGPIFRHLWTKVHRTRCGAEHSVRAALRVLPPGECYWLVNASHLNYGRWVGQNYGPIFRRLWTKVHRITSADAGETIDCNAVCRYLIPFRRYSQLKCEVVRNHHEKKQVFQPPFFGGKTPKFWT